MSKNDERQGALVHPVCLVYPAREDCVLDLFDEALLSCCVGEGVGGHVKEDKALFLCR